MKKALFIFFALISITTQGQVANGTETKQNAFRSLNPQTATTVNYLTTMGTDGTMGRVTPVNVTIPTVPLNYSVTAPTLGAHLQGIDNRFGTLVATTAGNTTRVWFTGDATTIGAGTFYLTNAVNKGTVANVSQSVINDDDQKKYFTQDLIGNAFATTTIFPPGVYAGNLSGSTTPNSAQQRFTVELYRCDTNGTPIASGVSGAPVGDLGVTVIIILDSGLMTLADGSVTNIGLSANLSSSLTINVGERIRYHVSAAKVGTNASNITESVWYGNSFNSYIDVPTPITSSGVSNLSTVTGATVTTALDNLNVGKANDANVIHTTGNETKSGILSFINSGSDLSNGINIVNNGTLGSYGAFNSNNGTGVGSYIQNTSTGTAFQINSATSSVGDLIHFLKNNIITSKITHDGGFVPVYLSAQNISAGGAPNNVYPLLVRTAPNQNFRFELGQIASLNDADSAYTGFMLGDNWLTFTSSGLSRMSSLSGTGTRTVVADASGNLSATSAAPISGNYIPTLTATSNCSSLSLISANYIKIGDIVRVSIVITGTVTSANTATVVAVTLPINKATSTAKKSGLFSVFDESNTSIAGGYTEVLLSSANLKGSTTGSSGTNRFFIADFQYNITE